ncbi:acyl-CoA-binding domain-containing protein 5-like [Oratosquilla oratoria]|uniref:acyl-CoA-binding domain-containing protein 5-like n=1 Tax=Oratosquilla oratoria TaxID=337810 RepID=UPI003F75C724
MGSEERFQAAVNVIRSLPKDGPYQPAHGMMLKFYGLYKQATEGPCTEPKPAFYEVVKGYKWRAWNALGNMSRKEAMDSYVEELKKIIETMSYTENVANFVDMLGPFYEYVDLPGKSQTNNNVLKDKDNEPDHEINSEYGILPNGHHNTDLQESRQLSDSEVLLSDHNSSNESSPQHLPNHTISDAEEDEDLLKEEESTFNSLNMSESETSTLTSKAQRVYSDTDSDEEYSEPAGTPDVMVTQEDSGISNQTYLPANVEEENMDTQLYAVCEERGQHMQDQGIRLMMSDNLTMLPTKKNGPLHEVAKEESTNSISRGGGDQSHPGGLQNMATLRSRASQMPTRLTGSPLVPTQPQTPCHSVGGYGMGGGGGRDNGDYRPQASVDLNAQLFTVLQRLQSDMENVLHRLHTLETLTVTQHQAQFHIQSPTVGGTSSGGNSWWPFPELSPRTTFILMVWPLILHGGIKLLLLLRSRRRRP